MSKQVHRYLVEKFDCGCLHLYEVVKEKKWSRKYKKSIDCDGYVSSEIVKKHIVQEEKRNKGVNMDTYNKSIQHQ